MKPTNKVRVLDYLSLTSWQIEKLDWFNDEDFVEQPDKVSAHKLETVSLISQASDLLGVIIYWTLVEDKVLVCSGVIVSELENVFRSRRSVDSEPDCNRWEKKQEAIVVSWFFVKVIKELLKEGSSKEHAVEIVTKVDVTGDIFVSLVDYFISGGDGEIDDQQRSFEAFPGEKQEKDTVNFLRYLNLTMINRACSEGVNTGN